MKTRRNRSRNRKGKGAVAVFHGMVEGTVVVEPFGRGVRIEAEFTKLPPGKHGFHIHKAGDLRGEGCQGACDHYHKGKPSTHGGEPEARGKRHTGDLGNVELRGEKTRYSYTLSNVHVEDLWGRSIIVHANEDDLGQGSFDDSKTTGHSGSRIACAIFGRSHIVC